MKKNLNQLTCDLCHKSIIYAEQKRYSNQMGDQVIKVDENGNEIMGWRNMSIPVVFTTEQNEGYPVKDHYFDKVTLDFCPECYQKFLKNYPILAAGGQGYNKYSWREED